MKDPAERRSEEHGRGRHHASHTEQPGTGEAAQEHMDVQHAAEQEAAQTSADMAEDQAERRRAGEAGEVPDAGINENVTAGEQTDSAKQRTEEAKLESDWDDRDAPEDEGVRSRPEHGQRRGPRGGYGGQI